jgi:uncharacterized membrane protein YvlD (DUF360 family)
MKKWSVGELQALRVAARFLLGLGLFAIVISGFLLFLYSNLTPEEKNNDVHLHDVRDGAIIVVVAVCSGIAGWKLRSFVRKLEAQTGKSAKPFGWMP